MVKKKSSCGCFGFFSFFSSKKRLQVISIPNSQSSQPVENNSPINSHQSDEKSKKNPKIEVITKLTSEDVKVTKKLNIKSSKFFKGFRFYQSYI